MLALRTKSLPFFVQAKPDPERVSLARHKSVARRLLPPSSAARSIILSEKDALPVPEALAKFEILDGLLSSELGP